MVTGYPCCVGSFSSVLVLFIIWIFLWERVPCLRVFIGQGLMNEAFVSQQSHHLQIRGNPAPAVNPELGEIKTPDLHLINY